MGLSQPFYFLFILAAYCKSYPVSTLAYESLCTGALFYPVKNHSQAFEDFQIETGAFRIVSNVQNGAFVKYEYARDTQCSEYA